MPLIVQKRYDGQSNSFRFIQEETISEADAKEINDYFTANTHRPMQSYEYTVTGNGEPKQYYSAIGDITGFIKAQRKKIA